MNDFTKIFNDISKLLQKGKAKEIVIAVEKALSEGAAPEDILEKGLLAGINVISKKFRQEDIFIPEVLVSSRAMNHAAAALKPALVKAGFEPIGKAIICTVKGDLHDIGKNLVKMMLEGKGIEVLDLGVDCASEKVVESVRQNPDARVVCLSALLTTTMLMQKDTIGALKAAGLRDKIKIVIGGAPVTQNFADNIGADAYSRDAVSAAELCRSFFV
jgi:5-methyltetrahydrofolate--homocysteine methyltransferase